jgi:hypothetical protein
MRQADTEYPIRSRSGPHDQGTAYQQTVHRKWVRQDQIDAGAPAGHDKRGVGRAEAAEEGERSRVGHRGMGLLVLPPPTTR